MKTKTQQTIKIYIKKLSVISLLIAVMFLTCCTQKVYELRKTDEGYRLTIEGYTDKYDEWYTGNLLTFSSLDDLRKSFLNKDFTLVELHILERYITLEDDNGAKIRVDLDNLYQPTINGEPLNNDVRYSSSSLHFPIRYNEELGYEKLFGTAYYCFNIKEEREIRNLIANKRDSLGESNNRVVKTDFEFENKKYELYQCDTREYTDYSLMQYVLFVYNEQAVFMFDLTFRCTSESERPAIDFFKLFGFEPYTPNG